MDAGACGEVDIGPLRHDDDDDNDRDLSLDGDSPDDSGPAGTAALLTEATRLNVNWAGVERFSSHDVAADPSLAHYTRLHPERGDFALAARVGGRVVGVVWLLFLDSSDPGFGYVADGVPELSVCVWPSHRRAGIGGMLLGEAIASARRRGLRRISLSVENGNPAERLYRSAGFVDAPDAQAGTDGSPRAVRPVARAAGADRTASRAGVAESAPCASTWERTTPASRPRTSSPSI